MELKTTQKGRRVEQVSFFVLPEEKKKIKENAKKDCRSISSFCKKAIIKKLEEKQIAN